MKMEEKLQITIDNDIELEDSEYGPSGLSFFE